MVNISVVYIAEDKKRIFELLKNILKSKNDEKCMFLYDGADFSEDMREYIIGNDILTFRSVNTANSVNSKNSENYGLKDGLFPQIDLTVLGECGNNINIPALLDIGKTKTFLLNTDNIDNFRNINFADAQIITCGLKEKDTVIFSSIDIEENSVILDLQRSIINIKNEAVEPFEKKITVNMPDIFNDISKEPAEMTEINEDLIFALTVLLFCDRL